MAVSDPVLRCYMSSEGAGRRIRLPMKRHYSDTSEEEEEEIVHEPDEEVEYWSSPYIDICLPHQPRQSKVARVLNPYLTAFFLLFEDDVVQDFLWVDSCAKVADKYLLAMVYVYFRRACLPIEQYSRTNFFAALYLANDMEEDEDEEKYEIFPWALGEDWLHKFPSFLLQRDRLWFRMNFRAVVSKKTCDEVITMAPEHEIWQRNRRRHHGGAIRAYTKPRSPQYGRTSPVYCEHCTRLSLLASVGVEEREGEGEGESEGWDMREENPVPKFGDLLDEIDFSSRLGTNGYSGRSSRRSTSKDPTDKSLLLAPTNTAIPPEE